MKTWIPVLCAAAVLAGCVTNKPLAEAPKVVVDYDRLERRDGLAYFKGVPFTGVAVEKDSNGLKEYELTYKIGKQHGLATSWWPGGGPKWTEGTFKHGKEHGLRIEWFENEQKELETNYRDGKRHGLETVWYSTGQKSGEGNYKDGKRHGLGTGWYENGQKMVEETRKDGKLISKKGWDEDGNLLE